MLSENDSIEMGKRVRSVFRKIGEDGKSGKFDKGKGIWPLPDE